MFTFVERNLLGPDLVIQPETYTDLNIYSELDGVQRKPCHFYSFTSKFDSKDLENS